MVCPLQEFGIRVSLGDRQELKPLTAEYEQIVATLHQTLKSEDQVANIFGPKLETNRTLTPNGMTNNIALPSFAPFSVTLSGLLVTNDQSHADLYAVGGYGYVKLIYQWDGSITYARIVLYLRPDASFLPLTKEDDLAKRLAWEKPKWLALQNWLQFHLPKPANELKKQ